MKTLQAAIASLLLVGCSSNPLLTGNPDDWKGKTEQQLRAGLGEPHRIVQDEGGSQIFEYVDEGTFTREHRSPGAFRNVNRYKIANGKVRAWYFARYENGELVRQDH